MTTKSQPALRSLCVRDRSTKLGRPNWISGSGQLRCLCPLSLKRWSWKDYFYLQLTWWKRKHWTEASKMRWHDAAWNGEACIDLSERHITTVSPLKGWLSTSVAQWRIRSIMTRWSESGHWFNMWHFVVYPFLRWIHAVSSYQVAPQNSIMYRLLLFTAMHHSHF